MNILWERMAFFYLISPLFLQCHKPQHNSFKIVFDLWLINAIDLHYHYRMKIYFTKKEHVRTLNSKKLKISHISIIKGTSPLRFSVLSMNNFAEVQLLSMMEFSFNTLPR